VLSPLSAFFDVEIVAHFYENAFDETAEGGLLEKEILPFDDIKIQAAEDPEKLDEFQKIKEFGDYWNNDFKSTRNLFLQLGSLQAVHSFPQVRDSDICLFLRPDLLMHTSFSKSIVSIRNLRDDRILLPFWQNWKGGLNDRFAFCRGERAKKAYACRGRHALEFCQRTGGALQSEQLLRYSVMRYGVKTQDLNATASRVRADARILKKILHGGAFEHGANAAALQKIGIFLILTINKGLTHLVSPLAITLRQKQSAKVLAILRIRVS